MKDIRKRIRIAVIGGSRPGRQALDNALEVGRLIARAGAVVVCGGLGGVMEAACRGAREEGGLAVGILPGGSPADANPWVDVPIATGLGYTRNALVVMNADAVIAVDGEYGTLSEIAYGKIHGKKSRRARHLGRQGGRHRGDAGGGRQDGPRRAGPLR